MDKLVQLLRRVPTALWVFIGLAQFLSIGDHLYRIPKLERAIEEMKSYPEEKRKHYTQVIDMFQEMVDSKRRGLFIAAALIPTALALAVWSYRRNRAAATPSTPTNNTALTAKS